MARVPFVRDEDAPEDVRAAFEAAIRFNGRVANSMRVFAHSAAIVKYLLPLQAVLQKFFDSTEIAELTTVAAFRGLMNRFMDSLHIELEGPELQARGGEPRRPPRLHRSW